MFGLGKAKSLVGLDIGSSAVKMVELRKKGDSYELMNLGIEALGQDTVVDGAIMDALSVSSAIEKIFTDNRIKMQKRGDIRFRPLGYRQAHHRVGGHR